MRRTMIWLLLAAAGLAIPAQAAPTKAREPKVPSIAGEAATSRRARTRPAEDKQAQRRRRRENARKIVEINRKLFKLFEQAKYDQCRPLLEKVLEIDPNNNVAWYNLACVHSRAGRKDQAVKSLETAVEHGYSDFHHCERDSDLDAIRQSPGYKRLIARKGEIQRQRAAKIRDQLREQFGEGYLYEIDHDRKLVFATNVDRHTLEEMNRRLTAYASAQWKHLFAHGFERYLTIVIPKSADWQWGGIGGFYARGPHMLYARTVGLTLIHEFTHALHAADQEAVGQQHPIWITEGLATLFESSKLVAGRSVPQPNRRLIMLQAILRRKRTIPFGEFVRLSHPKFMSKATTAYAQGRYVMMYLHEKGLLKKWYDTYQAGYDDDRTGAKALEKVLGKKLARIEADWKTWAAALDPPVLRLPPKHAYLGIQLRAGIDGVQVIRVVPGSGAHKAGLKADDVIFTVDGERTIDPGQLMAIIYEHEVGDKVPVRYRRDGKYKNTAVTLGAMPGRQRRPRPKPKPKPKTRPATTQPATRKAA